MGLVKHRPNCAAKSSGFDAIGYNAEIRKIIKNRDNLSVVSMATTLFGEEEWLMTYKKS
jgi:hypothetical protein